MNAVRRPCAVLILSFLVAACGGGGGGSPTPTPTPSATHAISGTAAPGAALKLTGAAEKTVTADADGHYQFTDLADGSYAVAPSLSGYSFNPPSTAVTLDGADRTGVDFSSAASTDPTHAISGTVSGVAGVSLALAGSENGTTTTGSGGHYQFAGLPDGQYTVTPSLAGYAFTPASAPITLTGADASGVDFTATLIPAPTHTISGTAGVPNATVKLSGTLEKTVTAGSDGHYEFTGLADGPYAVAASLSGYTFDPASAPVTLAGADTSGVNFKASAVSAPTHTISGTVSGATGVSLSLGGDASGTTTTGNGGFYQFTGLANGSYTITPSLSGYTFNPTATQVTLTGADKSGVSFTATANPAPTYSISGNAGVSKASVSLSGTASKLVTAGTDGSYQFTGLTNGSYTVTPSLSGYTFSPTATPVTLTGADKSGVSFTATANPAPTYSISGNAGISGATIALSGSTSKTATTAANGSYQFTGLPNGSYTVTPSLTGYTFSPTDTSVTLTGADKSGVNFTAKANPAPTYSISGNAGISGATVALSGSTSKTATSIADGSYQFTGLTNGSYTVTPSLSGYTFSPSAAPVTLSGANTSGVSFTATAVPPPTHSISGYVSPMGPAVSVSVNDGAQTLPVSVNTNGSFQISGLNNGTYTVRMDVSHSLASSCSDWSLSQQVTVKDADVSSVVFRPNCNVQITGTVSPPQQGVEIDGGGKTVFTNASGVYTLTVAPGSYQVSTPWPTASGPQRVNVALGHMTGVDFTLDRTGSVILFLTPDRHTGNLGGRNGADRICSAVNAPICAGSSSVHAVLSVSTTDTVALMPTSFGLPASARVRGVSGDVLAYNGWNDLFPDVASTVSGTDRVGYWTGSLADGSLATGNYCNGWTSSSATSYGNFGSSYETGMEWINCNRYSCDDDAFLLCACW